MKVKAVDIARALGVSKATVSLALNGKPGVGEKTRQEILAYKEKAEAGDLLQEKKASEGNGSSGKQITVLMVSGGMKNIRGSELDLWTDVKIVLEKNFRRHGYSMRLIYTDINDKADFISALQSCNEPTVSGVLVYATELKEGQEEAFDVIHKPIVFYDYVADNEKYPYISINNRQGIRLAVDELMRTGNRDIIYIGMPMPMYNYESRRRGFVDRMTEYGYSYEEAKKRVVLGGDTIIGARDFMLHYLDTHNLPQAFLCDSYHESIGLMDALAKRNIRIPEDVSMIGVDVLPLYMTGGRKFTMVRVPHTERAYWAAVALYKEIDDPAKEKMQMYVNCRLVQGETVAVREQ